MALEDPRFGLRPGRRVAVTTTSRPLPEGLRTSRPHRVEGTVLAVDLRLRLVVLVTMGWIAWAVPLSEVVDIEPLDDES